MESDRVLVFYGKVGKYFPFSQCHKCNFILLDSALEEMPQTLKQHLVHILDVLEKMKTSSTYTSAEKFMMMFKAVLFHDYPIFEKMANLDSPSELKKLGRVVKNFDADIWERVGWIGVMVGNYLKFRQNPELLRLLKGTGIQTIAEASPTDLVWGIGLSATDSNVFDHTKWRGQNKLGEVLMMIRGAI